MPLDKFQCIHCGATDFTQEGDDLLRCKYCHSLFRVQEPKKEKGGLVIGSRANVVFGKDSNVVVKGGMSVSPGAHVSFLGKLEIIERASQEKIEQAKLTLQNERATQQPPKGSSDR